MPADPVSRHVEYFGCDLKRSEVRAWYFFKDLEVMNHYLVLYGRVDSVVSPEERRPNGEDSRRWEQEQEAGFVWWSRGEIG